MQRGHCQAMDICLRGVDSQGRKFHKPWAVQIYHCLMSKARFSSASCPGSWLTDGLSAKEQISWLLSTEGMELQVYHAWNTQKQSPRIRKAREGKGDLVVLWLELANAYSSVPHKLVETTLNRNSVSSKIKDLILDYYSKFRWGSLLGE